MSAIVLEAKGSLPCYMRKMRCPRHYLLKPGGTAFVQERIPELRNIKEADAIALAKANPQWRLRLWRNKIGKNGRPILNEKDYYQPEISAAFASETIYEAHSPICQQCRRCRIK